MKECFAKGNMKVTTLFIAISLLQGKLGTVLFICCRCCCCSCCCHLSAAFLITIYQILCIISELIKCASPAARLSLILQIFGEYFAVTPTRLLQLQNDLLVICLLYMPTLSAIIVALNVHCTGLDSV